MTTSIYISNQNIEVVTGSSNKRGICVKDMFTTTAPADSVINGIIIDEEALTAHLKKFWAEKNLPKKDISLVVNSTQFVTKRLQVPTMSYRKTMAYIAREFADVERSQDPIYSYYSLREQDGKMKIRPVLASMVEKKTLESFIDLFASFGVKVTKIHAFLGSAIRVLRRLPYLLDKTCLIIVVDAPNVTSILFVDGYYTYSNRSRMFSDRDCAGVGLEIARTVSSMMQFAASEKLETPITNIYLCGISADEMGFCTDSIYSVNSNLSVEGLSGADIVSYTNSNNGSLGSSFEALCGLMARNDPMNFIKQHRKNSEGVRKREEFAKRAAPAAAIGLVLGAVAAGQAGYWFWQISQAEGLMEYVSVRARTMDCMDYDMLVVQNEALAKAVSAAKRAWSNIGSYPIMDSRVDDVLNNCAEGLASVKVKSYDAALGLLRLESSSSDQNKVHQFIELLGRQDIFEDINYTGFVYQENGAIWVINAECTLAAGKNGDQEAGS